MEKNLIIFKKNVGPGSDWLGWNLYLSWQVWHPAICGKSFFDKFIWWDFGISANMQCLALLSTLNHVVILLHDYCVFIRRLF